MTQIAQQYCRGCGHPVPGMTSPNECANCRGRMNTTRERCNVGRLYGSQEHRCALPKDHTGDHEAYFQSRGFRVTIGWKDPRSPVWRVGGR